MQGHDYAKAGYCFVTICTQGGEHLFGRIEKGKVVLNKFGEITKTYLLELPIHYCNLKMDEYTIMPDHVYAIMILCDRNGHAVAGAGFKPAAMKKYLRKSQL